MKQPWHPSPVQAAVGVFICSILAFFILWFVFGTAAHRICAVVALPLLNIWFFLAIFREKRADKKAAKQRIDYLSGDYFRDPAWREAYLRRKMEHGFESCHPKGMRYDMMQRYRRKSEPITFMVMSILLLVGCICGLGTAHHEWKMWLLLPVGLVVFGYIFWIHWSEFTARPVRKWLRENQDAPQLAAFEKSWLHGRILSYQRSGVVNGICLSPTHIILYDKRDVHTVELSVAESMTREIVREKTYQDYAYADEKYRFFAVLHIRTAQGKFTLKTELDEFQTEMAIEEFARLKGQTAGQTAVSEQIIYETVT